MARIFAWWLAGGVVTAIALAILTATLLPNRGWLGYLALALDGNTATAKILRTDPDNHCLAEYAFDVGGAEYEGSGALCSAVKGQSIEISYLPANPRHSCIGHAGDALLNEVLAFVAGGVLFPPVVMFGLWRWRRHASRKREA